MKPKIKNVLMQRIMGLNGQGDRDFSLNLEVIVNEFFNSNIVIEKGVDRHPYADVWHEWIEGATMQYKTDSGWMDYRESSVCNNKEHRIKPTEQVYEYQYLITTIFEDKANRLSKFLTDDEFKSLARSRSEGWTKLEASERLRKY